MVLGMVFMMELNLGLMNGYNLSYSDGFFYVYSVDKYLVRYLYESLE